MALVRAAGGEVRTKISQGWIPLERFETEGDPLRRWRQPVILGEPEAVETLCRRHG